LHYLVQPIYSASQAIAGLNGLSLTQDDRTAINCGDALRLRRADSHLTHGCHDIDSLTIEINGMIHVMLAMGGVEVVRPFCNTFWHGDWVTASPAVTSFARHE
jgi:hypothetical protein